MIHLVTGTPGAGKTLRVVELIAKAAEEGRRICVHGIPDLLVPHVKIGCSVPGCEFCGGQGEGDTVENWQEWAVKNDLIILDEVQRQFRNRPAGSSVPAAVAALETHRHRGVDFIVITQSPSLIDQNIRKLITVHDHIKPLALGQRRLYTWSECNDNPKSNLAGADSRLWRLNKKIFGMYRSAELHTKQKTRIPRAVYVLAGALLLAGGLAYTVKSRVEEDLAGGASRSVVAQSSPGQGADSLPGFAGGLRGPVAADPLDVVPEDPLVLESAPAYRQIVRVQDFPRLAGCISTPTRCKCYTQQGTEYPTTALRCHDFIAGKEFSPYVPGGVVGQ